jgi:hypothetical protein
MVHQPLCQRDAGVPAENCKKYAALAGTAAALSARRLGVDVTIVERYGYLGGLATGGLVLAIFPIYDRNNRQV